MLIIHAGMECTKYSSIKYKHHQRSEAVSFVKSRHIIKSVSSRELNATFSYITQSEPCTSTDEYMNAFNFSVWNSNKYKCPSLCTEVNTRPPTWSLY